MDLDQAGLDAQGRDWWSASGRRRPSRRDLRRYGLRRPRAAATVCRIRHPSGWTIECASFPEVSWMSALMSGAARMMRPVGEVKVYLHREPIDMRRAGTDWRRWCARGCEQDPFASQALYVFIGRRYDVLKILGWDRNGFAVWWKKIESEEKFHWPRMLQEDVVTLTSEQLNWLLDGYDVWSAPHRMIRFTHVS